MNSKETNTENDIKFFNKIKKDIDFEGAKISIETGELARQADAAVKVQYGETIVLCTLSVEKKPKELKNFLPLTVNFFAKSYAFNRIRGGYIKRDGKQGESEILVSRIIDRSIRPLIQDGFYNEIHLSCTVITHDGENNPDIPSVIGASAVLMMAGIPLKDSPASMVRVILDNEKAVCNPQNNLMKGANLELLVSGTDSAILMIENCAQEISEEKVYELMEYAQEKIKILNGFIRDFIKDFKENEDQDCVINFETLNKAELDKEIYQKVTERLPKIYQNKSKRKINILMEKLRDEICQDFSEKYIENVLSAQIDLVIKQVVRESVLEQDIRIDGRKFDEIRDIDCQTNVLSKLGGSALFTRGNTQVLSVVTIGSINDEQSSENINSLSLEQIKENFMLHYSFYPYATGDVAPIRSAGRREIGHGYLAQKAIKMVLPEMKYTIRIAAEVLESDGSSSMATVCSASMAMLDAGAEMKNQVAGVAMGFFANDNKNVIVSDIAGIEDFSGLMDCKIAGTKDGITAMQMDVKTMKINLDIIKEILHRSNTDRLKILDKMNSVIHESTDKISENHGLQHVMNIDKSNIKYVIGSGGKNIKEICELTKSKIHISREGELTISAESESMIDKAKNIISKIIQRPKIGETYLCKVLHTGTGKSGIFIEFLFKRKGLLSVANVNDYSEGMEVKAILQNINSEGKCFFVLPEDKDKNFANPTPDPVDDNSPRFY